MKKGILVLLLILSSILVWDLMKDSQAYSDYGRLRKENLDFERSQPDLDIRNAHKLNIQHTKFQALGPGFYVYSAYFDSSHVVKIVAMRRAVSEREEILCILEGVSVLADMEQVMEKHRSTLFMAVILTCSFRQMPEKLRKSKAGTYLELSRNNRLIQVLLASQWPTHVSNLARCIPMLYGHVDMPFVHSILSTSAKYGVDHFQFYAHPQALAELETGLTKSIYNITIKLWQLPVDNFQVWYYGQIGLLQDCLYSMRWRTRFLLVADLDEYLMPISGLPFLEDIPILEDILKITQEISDWNIATVDGGCCFSNRTSEGKGRTLGKYVVRPERVASLGVHKVNTYEKGYENSVNVSQEMAVVVHCQRGC